MAVTFIRQPQTFTPSDNPIIWVFSSNQTAQANFSFVVEVYVNNVLDSRHEIFPEVSNRAHFDAQEIGKRITLVSSIGDAEPFAKIVSSTSKIYIRVRERFGPAPVYQASAISATATLFKARLSNVAMSQWQWVDYSADGAPFKFLGNAPATGTALQPNSDYFISFFPAGETNLALTFNLYEADGTLIPSAEVALPNGYELIQINAKVQYLTGIIPQSSFDAAAYMDLSITQAGGDPLSEVRRIYFDRDDCGKHTQCVWLNRFGSFDTYTFQHNTVYTSDISSFTFERQFGGWQGLSYALDPTMSGVLDYLKRTQSKLQLISAYISESEQHFLTEMLSSPMVYIVTPEGYERMRVDTNSFTLQNDLFEEEFTAVVDMSFPNVDYSQVT